MRMRVVMMGRRLVRMFVRVLVDGVRGGDGLIAFLSRSVLVPAPAAFLFLLLAALDAMLALPPRALSATGGHPRAQKQRQGRRHPAQTAHRFPCPFGLLDGDPDILRLSAASSSSTVRSGAAPPPVPLP